MGTILPARVLFQIEVDSGNAAMIENPVPELFTMIEKAKEGILEGKESGRLFDSNGNHSGFWNYSAESEEETES